LENNPSSYVMLGGFSITAQIPEPSTLALAAVGLLGLAFLGRRRRKR
jgi:hypothetical protein